MRSQERRAWGGLVPGSPWPAVVGAAAVALACSPAACGVGSGSRGAHAFEPGWVDAPAASARAAPAARNERWDLARQLENLRPAGARARSEHLGGELEGEVLASAASGYPLHGPSSAATAGATLVERLFGAGAAQPSTYFVMIKRAPGYDPPGGDWEYLVVAPDGSIEERGTLPLCARCHAEAPHDHLFGGGR